MDTLDVLIVVLAAAWLGFGIWAWIYPSLPERIRRTARPEWMDRMRLFWMMAAVQALFIVLLLLAFAISRLI